MDGKELSRLTGKIARSVIEKGLVDPGEGEFWLVNLGATVVFETNELGYENATEIAEEAVRVLDQHPCLFPLDTDSI